MAGQTVGQLKVYHPKINGVIQLPFSQTYYQVLVPNTVDGKNPAPVEVGIFSHYL